MTKILLGDCRAVLKSVESNSVDSVVTDPPYELGFMDKSWDASGVAYDSKVWSEIFRVLKPGGHLLAFGGSRTWHRLACAIEDCGFQIRESIAWIYGEGFPKGINIGKALDKRAGVQGPVVGKGNGGLNHRATVTGFGEQWSEDEEYYVREIVSEDGKKWEGWHSGLRPSFEPIVVARKPFVGSLVDNVLENGVGAYNVKGCAIEGGWTRDSTGSTTPYSSETTWNTSKTPRVARESDSRWPPNVALGIDIEESAFFFCAKAQRGERQAGLGSDWIQKVNNHPTVKPISLMKWLCRLVTPNGGVVLDPFLGSGTTGCAAALEGFSFVGIELDPEYVKLAESRIRYWSNPSLVDLQKVSSKDKVVVENSEDWV